MDGEYHNNMIFYKKISDWIIPILSGKHQWESNNFHIDEFPSFKNISRENWIEESLRCFNFIINNIEISKPYLFFLHFDLLGSKKNEKYDIITFDFLKKNISEYTPPSFNCTTDEYFNDFYKKELCHCSIENKIYRKFISKNEKIINCYFRTYYDKSENEYSRELYIFLEN